MRFAKCDYPADMDKSMIPICNVLNAFDGVRTVFCCSGHGHIHHDVVRRLERHLGISSAFYICCNVSCLDSLKQIVKFTEKWSAKHHDMMLYCEMSYAGALSAPPDNSEICCTLRPYHLEHAIKVSDIKKMTDFLKKIYAKHLLKLIREVTKVI